jgi:FlgD Ig-like domain/Galactose oxidase, central domain
MASPRSRSGQRWRRSPALFPLFLFATHMFASDPTDPASILARTSPTAGIDGAWEPVLPKLSRAGHTAVYDPVDDRMIVFGGFDGIARNDTWQLGARGDEWRLLAASGPRPPGRRYHHSVYDPSLHRMIVIGGTDQQGRLNDVWFLWLDEPARWEEAPVVGDVPSPVYGHSAVLDPVRNRILLFGGFDSDGWPYTSNSLWAFSLDDFRWELLAPGGTIPPRMQGHAAIYDAPRDRMIVYQGGSSIWSLSISNLEWTQLAAIGGVPLTGREHTAILDPIGDRIIVFGGLTSDFLFSDETWSLSIGDTPAWTRLTDEAAPDARWDHSSVYDPIRRRMLVFGGSGDQYLTEESPWGDDVHALSLDGEPQWSSVVGPGRRGPGRNFHSAIYDPRARQMVIYGGNYDSWDPGEGPWALQLSGEPAWIDLEPVGASPGARWGHSAVYDPVRTRMVVFGGDAFGQLKNDTWSLSLSDEHSWQQLPVPMPPSPRSVHTAILDLRRDRMVIFGGIGSPGSDTWALAFSEPNWIELPTTGEIPPASLFYAAVYDSLRDEMILLGGPGSSPGVWALSFANLVWRAIDPANEPPSAWWRCSMIHDASRDRAIVFGGTECWALALGPTPSWRKLEPFGELPGPRFEHSAVYDPERDRMVVFGGWQVPRRFDTWEIAWRARPIREGNIRGGELERSDASRLFAGTSAASDRAVLRSIPNPGRFPVHLHLSLPSESRVRAVIMDVSGRLVRTLFDNVMLRGQHEFIWDGVMDNGRPAASGFFFVAVETPGERLRHKILLMRD